MKKIFTLMAMCILSMGTSFAQKIAYILPDGCEYNNGVFSGFPEEATNNDAYATQTMELNAASWFKANIVDAQKGDFVAVADLATADLSKYDLIWVNVERIALADKTELKGNYGFNDQAVDALKAYVQAGGNLYLSKQATWIAYYMGRIGYAPTHENAGGFELKNNDDWFCTQALLGYNLNAENQADRTGHAIYAGLEKSDNADYWHYAFKMTNAEVRTSNIYCSWIEFCNINGEKKFGNGDKALLTTFENDWNAQCLAQRGNIGDYCFMDIVEFLPGSVNSTNWKGTILCNGASSYQWTKSNDGTVPTPVTTLTDNILSYLTSNVTLYDGRDISYASDFTANVTLDREFTAGEKSTVILPFALSAEQCEACGQFYTLSSINGTNVVFSPVTTTEANKPYILVPANSGKLPEFTNVNVEATEGASLKTDVNGGSLIGSYTTQALASAKDNGNYTYYQNNFSTTAGTITVKPFRAYVHLTMSGASKMNVILNDATGISSVEEDAVPDDNIYSISGVKMAKPGKGINVCKGKKFIVK